MRIKNVFFWLVFMAAAIWGQRLVPGVDFLASAPLVSMQERRPYQTLILVLAALCIQEGSGTLAFGAALLWYAGVLAIYLAGCWLLEAESILFVSLVGLAVGGLHYALFYFMPSLQQLARGRADLPLESLIQALSFPLIWGVLRLVRKKQVRHAELA